MMINDFIHTFLFQEPFVIKDNTIHTTVLMDSGKEGWMGIPHGGIGMGTIMELSTGFSHCMQGMDFKYPIDCRFDMGGAKVKIGDTVEMNAMATDSGITGNIRNGDNAMPYVTGDIGFGQDRSNRDDCSRTYLPDHFSRIKGHLEHIPHYQNCFVCGVNRSEPGLKRKFHFWDSPHGKVVCAFSGFNEDDKNSLHLFQRNGFFHPISLLAILDETMGWAGFMAYANGGVSVRLNYQFLRPVNVNEKMVFFARAEKVKGHIDRRMLFWASGFGTVMHEDGSFEVVAVSSGQWYAMKELTDQMRNELIPQDLTHRIFSIAQSKI
ncbi:MAG: PaaI family thioesterase [Proteobacteria bacterium]|nr:PaaI family thioesterase [Pseudomonadota bacterium]MBU1389916.1 PaaI family thioesterase [Pseudomonadota bacterium]MBU1542515.1 PaaI family thioesterase [Pseudomonadota bacterium]MBU2429119.1 PaaI family thioesterase [Pseudomonadota bacterium]MBU2479684.1 PaaI family thioesterase [Pseudomonadota bacterium]